MAGRKDGPRLYPVSAARKRPLLDFILNALRTCGCHIVFAPPVDKAPYRVVFDTPDGARHGIVVYAFLANSKPTRNRPADEYRFQIKYGTKDGELHDIWQDPYEIYTTLLVGIDPGKGFFVGADPVLHNPTRHFISLEFKQTHVERVVKEGWAVWEREKRNKSARTEPVEVLVAGRPEHFLRYIQLERDAMGEDQGHRQLIAEQYLGSGPPPGSSISFRLSPALTELKVHALATEFQLAPDEILDLIAQARRLKMAVRGWVAEEHLARTLRCIPGITECCRIEQEGGPDISLRYRGSRLIKIECKNVLHDQSREGFARLDFQRTRASKSDPCSRYYRATDFDLVAACLHAVTRAWEFRYLPTAGFLPHKSCTGRLASNVNVDNRWHQDAAKALIAVLGSP